MAKTFVFGTGGQKSPEAENYVMKDVVNAAPGKSDGIQYKFLINNPALRADNLSMETVKANAYHTFLVNFEPAAHETNWKLEAAPLVTTCT